MLRVVVVDDEYLVRERVKRCIDWAAAGFEIAGEASNGQDAIALVQRIEPHIVITDISMPYRNGLDFTAAIKEEQPKVKFIVLTGYSDFDYARTAITAGVSYYLLKPINQSELLEAVQSLKSRIEKESQMEEYFEQLQSNHRSNRSARRQQLLRDMLNSESSESKQKLITQFAENYPAIKDQALAVALIKLHYTQTPGLPADDWQLWRYAVGNIFEEVCSQIAHIEFVNYDSDKIAAIMNITQDDTVERLSALCRAAQNHIRSHLRMPITVGISGEIRGFSQIAHAFQLANKELRQRFILGIGSVIYCEDTARPKSCAKDIPSGIGTELLIYMRTGNISLATREIRGLFERFTIGGISMEALTLILSEMVLQINSFISEKTINASGIIDGDLTVDSLLDRSDDICALEKRIAEIVGELVACYNEKHVTGYANLVARTKQYIEENYSYKDISLEMIAVNISVNPCYLSTVFKKESGVSIVEYLTRCRMLNAKRMLDHDGIKLAEVADAVGFNDPYYFSKCFKKTFGMSPSHYLRQNKQI